MEELVYNLTMPKKEYKCFRCRKVTMRYKADTLERVFCCREHCSLTMAEEAVRKQMEKREAKLV